MKFSLLLILLGLITTAAHGATVPELLAERAADKAAFDAAGKNYLLGRMAETDGQISLAAESYRAVADGGSVLMPYALAHLARISRSIGDLIGEQLYLTELEMRSPKSLWSGASQQRMAESLAESGNFPAAVSELDQAIGTREAALSETSRSVDALRCVANSRSGTGEARSICAGLLAKNDDASLAAVRELDRMDANSQLTPAEHLQRAGVYQANREFASAREHYSAVLSAQPTGPLAGQATFELGRGYAQAGDLQNAILWLTKARSDFPGDPIEQDAQMQLAAVLGRSRRNAEAIALYQDLIDRFPQSDKLERAYLNIVDAYRDSGDDAAALDWCARTKSVFPGKRAADLATFASAKVHIGRGEWDQALSDLRSLQNARDLGQTVPGGTNPDEVAFLTGLAAEHSGSPQDAHEAFSQVAQGWNSYYGALALTHFGRADDGKLPPQTQKSGAPIKDGLRSLVNDDPAAGRLLDLGLEDEAAFEIDAGTQGQKPLSLALAYEAGSRPDRGLAIAEPQLTASIRGKRLDEIPRQTLTLLFPVPHSSDILRYSAENNVDPRFLLAVMRQESRFDPGAKSGAAARGLMQFVKDTSDRIESELQLELSPDDLYDPAISIRLGSRYVADLFKKFAGKSEAVAAAYNAGEDNVDRWLARAKSDDPAIYVPDIAYSQTKDYVFKVMANFRVYSFLYDEQLRPR